MTVTCTALGFTTFEVVQTVLFVGAVNVSNDGSKPLSSSLGNPPNVYGTGVMGKPR